LPPPPPPPGLLAQLHIDLLRGIAHRHQLDAANWLPYLANRLVADAGALRQHLLLLPFHPKRGREAPEYAVLPARERWVG
jgi:hypothetical protein